MHFANQPRGSDAALAALTAIEGDPVPFMRAAFAAYWEQGADLDDIAVVSGICERCGIDKPDFTVAAEARDAIRETALDLGIFETPSFVIAEQLYLGREHLPWIRSIIEAG